MEVKFNTQFSPTALKAMEETIQISLKERIIHGPSIEDLQRDEEWAKLFNKGYVFVRNMCPKILEKIEKGDNQGLLSKNCWYLQDGVNRKTATAYDYGNPRMGKLNYAVAIFVKKPEAKRVGNILDNSKERIEEIFM